MSFILLQTNTNSLISNLEILDELTNFIVNHNNIEDIKEEQINQLLYLVNSWISVMQKELDLIEDLKVRN